MLLMNEISGKNFELHEDIFSYKNDLSQGLKSALVVSRICIPFTSNILK